MTIKPLLAHGGGYFQVMIVPLLMLAAFVAVLTSVVWLICRLFGNSEGKQNPTNGER
jgi:hypothetical protein